jgi:hypothetical protein
LLLALDDERSAELDRALRRCDVALSLLDDPGRRVASYDFVAPGLRACRARVLAALGREPEALSELGLLEKGYPAYASLESARRSVHLIAAAKRADFAVAAEISRTREGENLVPLREEDLGELACLEAGEPFTRDRKERLRSEIETYTELRQWLLRVAGEPVSRLLGTSAAS